MIAEAALKQCGALERFCRDNADAGYFCLRKSPAAMVPALPVAEI